MATSQRRKVKGRSLRSDSFSRLQCHSLLDVRVMQLVCRGRGRRDTGGGGGGTKRAGGDRETDRDERETDRQTERQTVRRLSIRWRCLLNECLCPRTDLERTDHAQDIKVRAVC